MKTHLLLAIAGLSVSFITPAFTQTTPKELVGTWTMVSITLEKDGKKTEPYGPHPQGQMMRDAEGHFSFIVTSPDLPKFASGKRTEGTAEENKAVVQGSTAYSGTFTGDEAAKTYILHFEVCTFPNWVGIDHKASYTINGDELTSIASGPHLGGGTVTAVYKRAK